MFSVGAGHLGEEAVEQYVMGKMDLSEAEAIEDHVLICQSCQERIELTETYVRSMRSALTSASQPRTESTWRDSFAGWFHMPTPVWAGALAVVLLSLAGTVGLSYFGKTGTPVAVALTATRGETASVAASGPLDLKLDTQDLSPSTSYRVQVVDGNGKTMWEQPSAAVSGGYVSVRVNKHLSAGQYFVRIFGADSGTPREYAIQIR